VFVSRSIRKPALRQQARALRGEGKSLRTIAATIDASLSSVSRWVGDIELPEAQRAALEAANPALNGRRTGQLAWSRMCRDERSRAQAHGRALARSGDRLHGAGCMLYWAEGSKRRNGVVFTNADAGMLRFFLRFLRECYRVADDQVRLSVNCHLGQGLTLEQIEQWWLETLDLPRSCLTAAAVNRPSRASKAVRRPLVHGTARLAISSTWLVQSIYGGIQEYAEIERPEWLD
jgi:hypothetical protein